MIIGVPGNYSGVIPPNGETQDLDVDGFITPSDYIILQKMILGAAIGPPGLVGRTRWSPWSRRGATVAVGFTTHVTVGVRNEAAKGTPGFGVVFEIVSGPEHRHRDFTWRRGRRRPRRSRYDVSGPIAPGGLSRIVLRIDSAGTLTLRARIPACGTPGLGRSCARNHPRPRGGD